MNAQSLSGPTLFCGVWRGSSPRSKRDASMFVVCFCTCLSADFWLTMWMKSTGVAVYKSQCSLSRMILSMRRISAVEKLHPLCITRSLMEPITCVKRRKTKKGINIVLNELCCRSQSILTSSSSLILAARTREVNAMHRRYFGWAWKTPRDSGSGSFVWAGGLSLNAPETPPSCSFGLLPWQWTAGGWGCRLPVRRCLDRTGRAGSSLPAKGSFLGAALKRCLCPEKETTVGQNCCILKLIRASMHCIPAKDSPGCIRFWRQAPSRGGPPWSGPPPAAQPVGASPQPLGASWGPESRPGWLQGTNTWRRREFKTQVTKATFRR